MPETDYTLPGNTKKSKAVKPDEVAEPPKKKLEKVTTGDVIVKEKGMGARLKGLFFGEDFKNVMRYVTAEVLLPAARNLIVDMTTRGVERAVYGENRSAPKAPNYYGHTSYHTPVSRPHPSATMLPKQPPHYPQARAASPRPGQDVLLVSRDEAELVLERMLDVIAQYEVVSVADLNELIGEESKHTDHKWGWYSLGHAQIRQTRNGYLIDLPPVEPI